MTDQNFHRTCNFESLQWLRLHGLEAPVNGSFEIPSSQGPILQTFQSRQVDSPQALRETSSHTVRSIIKSLGRRHGGYSLQLSQKVLMNATNLLNVVIDFRSGIENRENLGTPN